MRCGEAELTMIGLVGMIALAQALVSFTAIDRGEMSGVDAPRQVVIRTSEEWQTLWREHNAGKPAPSVDFSTSAVVGVFLGSRPTAGFQVEIVRVETDGGVAVIEYVERKPPPGAVVAQILTSPFHLVSLRHDGEVRFRTIAR